MAWTTKGHRFGEPRPEKEPGPGAYYVDKGIHVDPSYAPFGSTAPKSAASKDSRDSAVNLSPPPGAYDPKLPGPFDAGLPRRHVPFSHSATRIDITSKPKTDHAAPGPGQYKVDLSVGPVQSNRTMGVPPGEKPMLRSSSAPSIPRNHQSYGYEEVGGGRLVRQGPKDGSVFLTGRPADSAGPGHYEVAFEQVRPRATNGRFNQGPARSHLGPPMETPGPGHYVAKPAIEVDPNPWRQGSSFASQSDRLGKSERAAKREAEGPGPGQYVQNSPKRPHLRELRSELQYFGSTVERFKLVGDKTAATAGPGSYADINRKPVMPNARGFCSTDGRWKDMKVDKAPGPGDYQLPGGTEDHMTGPLSTFSMLGNSGGLAFGAMSKRLSSGTKDDMPGPGYYALRGMTDPEPEIPETTGRARSRRPRKSTLPGAAFASQTAKDSVNQSLMREGQMRPPPGAYDPIPVKDQVAVVRLRSKSEGFLSAEQRFKTGDKTAKDYHATVGPGKYMPGFITGGKRMGTFNRSLCDGVPIGGRPKGLGFDVQDKRFKRTKAEFGPGPGDYNTDPGWITKSHNCYFGDLT